MKKKYIVTLTEEERQTLRAMLSRGGAAARKLMHARILLKADASPGGPGWKDDAIAEGLVHSAEGQRRVRLEDGRRAGRVQEAVRSRAADGVPGRDQQAVDR